MNKFQKEIIILLKKQGVNESLAESLIETPKSSELGDYAFPCFTLSKEFKKDPKQIANELSNKIKPNKLIEKIHAVGPFLNFFINKTEYSKDVLTEIFKKKHKFGVPDKKNKNSKTNLQKTSIQNQKKRIMVEFCSPNTNKPLHLGHVRNCVIGEAVSNILKFQNHKVIKSNLVNDRGIHICKSMLAYQKWGSNKLPDIKPDFFVGKYYVMFSQKAEEEKKSGKDILEKEAQLMLQKWEQGDKKIISLWKRMNTWVYEGFNETYKSLGAEFDRFFYESKIYKEGKEIILNGLKEGIFSKDETGAIIADMEKEKLGKKVLVRADGTTIYITQDIYLAKLKFENYKLDESIYVVGSEQNLHFQILFKILEMLGYKWAKNCRHLSYGMVYLPEGKMKSREGKVVDADDLVKEVIELARFEIKERHKDLNDKEIEKRARAIGLGALKFYLLKTEVAKDIHYDPKESISFEGETGPYVQYTYARLSSVLRKLDEKLDAAFFKKTKFNVYDEKEKEIIRMLGEFPEIARDASAQLKPSIITRYLLDLSQKTNEFYHANPILAAPEELLKARIVLAHSARQVIGTGLNLLGIEAIEEM